MGSPHRLSAIISFALLFSFVFIAGCGSDSDVDPYESQTTREIREKVQADMESDRLRRISKRLASVHGEPNGPQPAHAEGAADAEEAGTPLERGEASYTEFCSSCHGARGQGDGPLAAALVPQPAKHADGSYMNPLSEDHLFKVIKQGGGAVGKSPMMAPWGTTLSDQRIRDVIEFIRTLADPPYAGAAS